MEPLTHTPQIWRGLADVMAAASLISPDHANRVAADLQDSFSKAAQPLPPDIDE